MFTIPLVLSVVTAAFILFVARLIYILPRYDFRAYKNADELNAAVAFLILIVIIQAVIIIALWKQLNS